MSVWSSALCPARRGGVVTILDGPQSGGKSREWAYAERNMNTKRATETSPAVEIATLPVLPYAHI
jgi:hypothetical protein